MSSEPTGLIAKSGIELLTFSTPNGYKASILLEELRDAYGLDYTWQSINISKGTQKEPWYTALNPNGRIPTIVDHDRGGFAVFEGIAILLYLARHYDPDHKFSFPIDSDEYSETEQWIGWQHGGLGPMQGQANHFVRYAKDKNPYAIQRYVGETERLYGVLDARLAKHPYVVGDRYSIADMSMVGWVNIAPWSGVDIDQFPHVKAWFDRLNERPALVRGMAIPSPSSIGIYAMKKKMEEDESVREAEEKVKKMIADAKAQWGYKYSSP